MDRQNAVHPQGGRPLSHEEERRADTRLHENLENAMLGEQSQMKKTGVMRLHLREISRIRKSMETRLPTARGWGQSRKAWDGLLRGTGVLLV